VSYPTNAFQYNQAVLENGVAQSPYTGGRDTSSFAVPSDLTLVRYFFSFFWYYYFGGHH
jgi:hypothetical protein